MKDLFAEFTRLINKAFPTVVVIIIMTITLQLQLILVSRLDNLEISSAIGFANSLCLCLVLYLMLSINQSFMARLSFYKGQGNKHKMKLTVYQSILILLVVGLVQFLILAYIVPLAQLLNIKTDVIKYLKVYYSYALIGGLIYGSYDFVRQYLLVYDYNQIGLNISCISIVIQLVSGLMLVQYGIHGLGLTYVIGQSVSFIIIVIFLFNKLKDELPTPPTLDQLFEGFCEYLIYTFKITFISYADFLAYECMTIIATQLPQHQFSAHIFLSQFYIMLCSLCSGFQCILTNQLSYYLGNKDYNKVIRITRSAIVCFPIILMFTFVIINVFQNQWVYLYTRDQPTIEQMHATIPYINLLTLTDQGAFMFIGILKGIQLENVGVMCYAVGHYLYGMPSILFYFMPNYQLQGIWMGFGSGTVLICVCQYFFIHRSIKSFVKIAKSTDDGTGQLLINNQNIEMQQIN